jgi:hypothetical protein
MIAPFVKDSCFFKIDPSLTIFTPQIARPDHLDGHLSFIRIFNSVEVCLQRVPSPAEQVGRLLECLNCCFALFCVTQLFGGFDLAKKHGDQVPPYEFRGDTTVVGTDYTQSSVSIGAQTFWAGGTLRVRLTGDAASISVASRTPGRASPRTPAAHFRALLLDQGAERDRSGAGGGCFLPAFGRHHGRLSGGHGSCRSRAAAHTGKAIAAHYGTARSILFVVTGAKVMRVRLKTPKGYVFTLQVNEDGLGPADAQTHYAGRMAVERAAALRVHLTLEKELRTIFIFKTPDRKLYPGTRNHHVLNEVIHFIDGEISICLLKFLLNLHFTFHCLISR